MTETDKLPCWASTNTGQRASLAPEIDGQNRQLQIILTEQNNGASLTRGEFRPWVAPDFVEMDLRSARGATGQAGSDFGSGG